MNSTHRISRVLGIAFLLQFVTALSSGTFVRSAWFVAGDMGETLVRIANNPLLMRGNILLDMLTALGIGFLGAMLFLTLRKYGERIALTALGFYLLEVALLAVSRTEAFSLLRIAQEYAATGQPAYLLTQGKLAYESMDFAGDTLHMLAFCPGGILFYFLLYKSKVVPSWMALWGLVAVLPMLVGTIAQIFGYSIPFIFYAPYVPFELVIGIWILLVGIKNDSGVEAVTIQPRLATNVVPRRS